MEKKPEFSIECSIPNRPFKSGEAVPVMARVTHRSGGLPRYPMEIQFFINKYPIPGPGRQPISAETGSATTEFTIRAPGKHEIEAQVTGKSFRSKPVVVEVVGEKKERKSVEYIRTTEVELEEGRWLVSFAALCKEDGPITGAVIEVFDRALQGGRVLLDPTDESGVTTYEITFAPGENERYFEYVCGKVRQSRNIWR